MENKSLNSRLVNRYTGTICKDLFCPICYGLIEDPKECVQCEMHFCAGCIKKTDECFSGCRAPRYKRPHLLWIYLYEQLEFKCENEKYGCKELISYSQLKHHDCKYEPQKCPNFDKCGISLGKVHMVTHAGLCQKSWYCEHKCGIFNWGHAEAIEHDCMEFVEEEIRKLKEKKQKYDDGEKIDEVITDVTRRILTYHIRRNKFRVLNELRNQRLEKEKKQEDGKETKC